MSESHLNVRFFLSVVFIFSILTFVSQNVFAHARWSLEAGSLVMPRSNSTGLKEPAPCGGVARTISPVVLKSGDTVEVQFEETVNHTGHFRIAFSPAVDAGFDQNVLVDNIPEVTTTRDYTQTITLPDIACDDCTLQLIQFMSATNTNYYSCADIQLTATGAPPPPGGDVTPPADIANMSIMAGDTQAVITWTIPAADYFQTLILQDTQPVVTSPASALNYNVNDMIGSARVIYSANGSTYTAQNLVNGNTYYFKIFAYDTSLNYAAGVEMNVTLAVSPGNMAPAVSLIAEQSQAVTTTILQDAGNVIVQATVIDPNPSDNHSYNWTTTDSRLINLDTTSNNFIFNPAGLAVDTYMISVEVSDDGTPQQSTTATLAMEVVVPPAPLATPLTNTGSSGGGSLNIIAILIICLLNLARTVASDKYSSRSGLSN